MAPGLLIQRRAAAIRVMEGELNALAQHLELQLGQMPHQRRAPDTAHAELYNVEFMADVLQQIRRKVAPDAEPFTMQPERHEPAQALTTTTETAPTRHPPLPEPPPEPRNVATDLPSPAKPAAAMTTQAVPEEPTWNDKPLSYYRKKAKGARNDKDAMRLIQREPGIGQSTAQQIVQNLKETGGW